MLYGFDTDGYYFNKIHKKGATDSTNDVKATEQEVFEPLKNEAVKRGYKQGIYIVDMYNEISESDIIQVTSDKLDWEKIRAGKNCNDMALRDSDGNIIFSKGTWATIIETKTKEEAEKLLNCKILN